MSKAVIFGIGGQDGYYLSKLLLSKGYDVIGVYRRSSVDNTIRLNSLKSNKKLTLVEGDVTDFGSVQNILFRNHPKEVYNLAAQSHVATSFSQPAATWNATAGGCLNILEIINLWLPYCKFYQASSSEMFGKSFSTRKKGLFGVEKFQNEETPMIPQSPYAIAKLAAHHAVRLYRDSYCLFACSGILFNHESPFRGEQFVTRKITKWIGEYKKNNKIPKLKLGNLNASRDWGHAQDYVEAMWMMLQSNYPSDYVVSMQETHTVEEFLEEAFMVAGLGSYKPFVEIDQKLYRPSEVEYLLGDSSKIRETLGWKPKRTFKGLVEEMVNADS